MFGEERQCSLGQWRVGPARDGVPLVFYQEPFARFVKQLLSRRVVVSPVGVDPIELSGEDTAGVTVFSAWSIHGSGVVFVFRNHLAVPVNEVPCCYQ
jgi:hypothetical protein